MRLLFVVLLSALLVASMALVTGIIEFQIGDYPFVAYKYSRYQRVVTMQARAYSKNHSHSTLCVPTPVCFHHYSLVTRVFVRNDARNG